VLSNRYNFSPFIRNRGRWTRWWGQFLDWMQNWRYFCACALKKSPKHSENVFRQKSYYHVTGNRDHCSEWRCQIFDRKFLDSRFSACAVKICPKLAYCVVKSPQFSPLYRQSQLLNTMVFKPDINLILSTNFNKTANINVKKLNSLIQFLTATRPRPTSHN